MATRASGSGSAGRGALLVATVLLALAPPALHGQGDGLEDRCAGDAECAVAAAAVRLIHPRVGLGLFGGSPVPGSASTLGMRIGSLPRVSLSMRGLLVPLELPPLPDRGVGDGERAYAMGVSGQATVGVLSGWSPLPTVGGVFSVDAIGRLSWFGLPSDHGFEGGVFGAAAGVRIGVLRESFTLPGLSLTASYGRTTTFAYGDPSGSGDGFIEGSIGGLSATLAATKRVGPVGLTGGVSYDRYGGDVEFAHAGALAPRTAEATTARWSAFGNLSWTVLIFHASAEAGWQDAPTPEGLPPELSLDPTGWWAAIAFRISI